MKPAGTSDGAELLLKFGNALANKPPVDFDLGFTGASEKPETAALPFQVSPTADQTALLIVEMGEFDLHLAFAGLRPLAEDFQNEPGSVDYFCVPGPF